MVTLHTEVDSFKDMKEQYFLECFSGNKVSSHLILNF